MASASSVLMLVVAVELCSDTEFLVGESESVDVSPIVAKASFASAATSCERSFFYLIQTTVEVCF